MDIGNTGTGVRHGARATPLWVWALWALVAVLVASTAGLLVSTSGGTPSVVVVNDTSIRLHVFECANRHCTQGVSGDDSVLAPGAASAALDDDADGVGVVGEATMPGNRLVGCLTIPRTGHHPERRIAPASGVGPCPGQRPGSAPVIDMVGS